MAQPLTIQEIRDMLQHVPAKNPLDPTLRYIDAYLREMQENLADMQKHPKVSHWNRVNRDIGDFSDRMAVLTEELRENAGNPKAAEALRLLQEKLNVDTTLGRQALINAYGVAANISAQTTYPSLYQSATAPAPQEQSDAPAPQVPPGDGAVDSQQAQQPDGQTVAEATNGAPPDNAAGQTGPQSPGQNFERLLNDLDPLLAQASPDFVKLSCDTRKAYNALTAVMAAAGDPPTNIDLALVDQERGAIAQKMAQLTQQLHLAQLNDVPGEAGPYVAAWNIVKERVGGGVAQSMDMQKLASGYLNAITKVIEEQRPDIARALPSGQPEQLRPGVQQAAQHTPQQALQGRGHAPRDMSLDRMMDLVGQSPAHESLEDIQRLAAMEKNHDQSFRQKAEATILMIAHLGNRIFTEQFDTGAPQAVQDESNGLRHKQMRDTIAALGHAIASGFDPKAVDEAIRKYELLARGEIIEKLERSPQQAEAVTAAFGGPGAVEDFKADEALFASGVRGKQLRDSDARKTFTQDVKAVIYMAVGNAGGLVTGGITPGAPPAAPHTLVAQGQAQDGPTHA